MSGDKWACFRPSGWRVLVKKDEKEKVREMKGKAGKRLSGRKTRYRGKE